VTDSPYDEAGSRTRQAWQRTSLGLVAVTLLVVRSLVLDQVGPGPLLLALIPATAFLMVALSRMARLRHGESPPPPRWLVLAASAFVAGLAVAALASAIALPA
jgi:uncharacterized membrane protein YidH (DUF202 family)